MSQASPAETPLMKQYMRIKGQYPDALLLFRVGDFYETFLQDAITTAAVLGITLTRRNNGSSDMELAGFPHHALDNYLPKLVRAGHRVAICDQLEDPKQAKTIVKRGVTEVATPGVSFSDGVVDGRSNNWLAALCGEGERLGAAFLDITTGEFLTGEGNAATMAKTLESFGPSELLYPRGGKHAFVDEEARQRRGFALEPWAFTDDFAQERLLRQFGTASLKGFGIADLKLAQRAAGAVLHYLGETRHDRLGHIGRIAKLATDGQVWLDRFTVRNLELVAPVNEGGRTLLAAMDRCETPMGARLLKRWLLAPLVDRPAIDQRLDLVEALVEASALREHLHEDLKAVGDLERLAAKAAVGRVNPRELLQMAGALRAADRLRTALVQAGGVLERAGAGWRVPLAAAGCIEQGIEPQAPVNVQKGGVVRAGTNTDLDELRHITTHAKDLLLEVQRREAANTGIASLKVGYNNVFGYYLEVRHTHRDKVPAEWVRKQTLTGAERYITDELKALEERILSAEERILALEAQLFEALVQEVCGHLVPLQSLATDVARLDVLRGFALNAATWHYARPVVNDGAQLRIREGRHPVIEQQLPPGEPYVANDLTLDPGNAQLLVITGPNMSGKSALLRQTALIVLMAQCGSFVPAREADIGLVDRVFTRVGASDNLSTGESTFMVEMNETASILNNLSARSLLLMDEIGRGTSTYDGISIAWSIAEYLHEHPLRPKTLFATHYHEMNDMAETFPRIRNANVAVREAGGQVHFLRKLVPGGSDRSFGIHVARMAGMPRQVVERAERVLHHLEQAHAGNLGEEAPAQSSSPKLAPAPVAGLGRGPQLSFFQLDDPALEAIREELAEVDINNLTPVEALMKLSEIKRKAGAGKAKMHKA
ncbi:MAG: DNA mismatch repair protein MutS [Flavobacteriales bacterium]|nr:DNA mismatch repair protein MutS [Flavobacteriales bacterium]MBP9081207.1 DNA mismatch repair protein MutS [Flavobacteriales bacterium]